MHQKTVGMFLTVLLMLMEKDAILLDTTSNGEEATIIDDHDDDVFDANASGDEYTDYPGDVCYKTTRDQFLLWEYTGIIPQYVELLLNVYLKYAEP